MNFPIPYRVVGVTFDSMSFQNLGPREVEIPVGSHVGAFGVERRHDVHKGVDLYCDEGTVVSAIEPGEVVDIRPFTGPRCGTPWWCDTEAISVEGNSGVFVYGEIRVGDLGVGDRVSVGKPLGSVVRVLKKDKGRPVSMLHLALHHHSVLSNGVWGIGAPQPLGLLDPTNRLIRMTLV